MSKSRPKGSKDNISEGIPPHEDQLPGLYIPHYILAPGGKQLAMLSV